MKIIATVGWLDKKFRLKMRLCRWPRPPPCLTLTWGTVLFSDLLLRSRFSLMMKVKQHREALFSYFWRFIHLFMTFCSFWIWKSRVNLSGDQTRSACRVCFRYLPHVWALKDPHYPLDAVYCHTLLETAETCREKRESSSEGEDLHPTGKTSVEQQQHSDDCWSAYRRLILWL